MRSFLVPAFMTIAVCCTTLATWVVLSPDTTIQGGVQTTLLSIATMTLLLIAAHNIIK